MNSSYKVAALVVGIGILIGVFVLAGGDRKVGRVTTTADPTIVAEGTATVANGIQYVDITAQAGYSPRTIRAQAGMQTIIRMKTENTYDCSSALVIPALGYTTTLSPTGVVEIPVPADKAQGTLEGRCSMGMYRFGIVFG